MFKRARRKGNRLEAAVLAGGLVAAGAAFILTRAPARESVDQAWPAFALVMGLLLIGYVANEDGLFEWAGSSIARLPGSDTALFVLSMMTVAAVTVVFNLDTSVLFLTPTLVHVARARGVDETPYLYGTVMMSNSASLLLPGSNLTNLIVLHRVPVAGRAFAAQMFPAWAAAVVTTGFVLILHSRRKGVKRASISVRPAVAREGAAAAIAATLIIILTSSPALPVLAIGLVTLLIRRARGKRALREAARQLDPTLIAGLFGLAIGVGALGRAWTSPARLLRPTSAWGAGGIGVVASLLLNNLPAAMLLSARGVNHARPLLVGLNLGPNLAVTGSLSAVLWFKAARSVEADASARRYTIFGGQIVPLAGAAAVLCLLLFSRGSV